MGQAKARNSHKKKMGFNERLQSDASDVVRDARYLVESGFAKWQIIELEGGEKWIGLMFKTSVFALVEGKLSVMTEE